MVAMSAEHLTVKTLNTEVEGEENEFGKRLVEGLHSAKLMAAPAIAILSVSLL